MARFHQYATYYDLINRDKPYQQEAAYVAMLLRRSRPRLVDLLELGSGTGRHGYLLAADGFRVHGVECSPHMVERAETRTTERSGSFQCSVGDIRTIRLGRRFDAVVSLFHVMSYQITNSDFAAVIETATCHLASGGLFLFDVWHGPAVLFQNPSVREKTVIDGDLHIVRKATPELRTRDNLVVVTYEFTCTDYRLKQSTTFSETHPMRYFFEDDILRATSGCFDCISVAEMLTEAAPSRDTWAATYLLQKR